jgi:hypothetical protein
MLKTRDTDGNADVRDGAVDRASAGRAGGIGAVARVLLVGCLLAAALGSRPLVAWAEANPDLPEWVDDALTRWDEAMSRMGLAKWHPLVRGVVERVRER